MPEGPSVLILKEAAQQFAKQKVVHASGNAKIDMSVIDGKKIKEFRTWGKQFFICFDGISIRIHLLMFGSYSINEFKEGREPRLSLEFKSGSLNFYTCSVRLITGSLDELYDWSADVLSDDWDAKSAKAKIKELPKIQVCDALLNQEIFSGVGNIIKNEVLYRIKVHPASLVGSLPVRQLNSMIKEARNYSFDFLAWKKDFELRKHWLAYDQKICKRCNLPFIKKQMGKNKRRTFYCDNCQILYK
jgi:endonuclease-8